MTGYPAGYRPPRAIVPAEFGETCSFHNHRDGCPDDLPRCCGCARPAVGAIEFVMPEEIIRTPYCQAHAGAAASLA